MQKPFVHLFLLAALVSILVSGFMTHPVSAHQTITVGNYQVEIGWEDEPPIVGQRNAIVVNLTLAPGGIPPAGGKTVTIDISRLVVSVVYGGETKVLTLQPLSEDSQNQYIAPLLPTRPGKYTVTLTGLIGTSPANAAVQPEEVETADSLQFPLATNPAGQQGGLNLPVALAGAALVISFIALGISVINLLNNRR